ncbi:MAG: hypothetical protein KDK45_26185, partial [Leptospiraceae bacterium]|nr:hypothetical protein [Leptospiraceae bacterium]
TEVKYTENTFEPIKKFPFNSALMKKLSSLLSILNELSSCFDFLGGLNQRGLEIIKQYFQGEKADFSDESQTNKNKFQTGLTFDINGTQVFCPWHGKARAFNDQYRIHFTWPDRIEDDEGNKQIYIVYIGEKITKA